MKRAGHLFDLIWTRENLLSAFSRAAKGKWASDAVRRFAADLDDNLRGIAQSLRAGEPRFGDYQLYDSRPQGTGNQRRHFASGDSPRHGQCVPPSRTPVDS